MFLLWTKHIKFTKFTSFILETFTNFAGQTAKLGKNRGQLFNLCGTVTSVKEFII
jgi:hypothetical protein